MCHTMGWEGAQQLAVGLCVCADFTPDIPVGAGWLILAGQEQKGMPAEAQTQFYPLLMLILVRC